MENVLQVFKNDEFGELRTLSLNGEPYAVGKDVAKALGYKDTKDALKKHVDPEDKIIINEKILKEMASESKGGEMHPLEFVFDSPRGLTFINESGLYSLILSSKLPTAKKFKRWVTAEVLPSIRKTGYYAKDNLWTEKEKAEMLKELAALATDETYRHSILKEATELITGRPLKLVSGFYQKDLYDAEEVEKFVKNWLAKNFFHIAAKNGDLPPLDPERGFYHKGHVVIYPVEDFEKDAAEAGFDCFLKLVDTMIDKGLARRSNKYRRRKQFRRGEKFQYGIELDDF